MRVRPLITRIPTVLAWPGTRTAGRLGLLLLVFSSLACSGCSWFGEMTMNQEQQVAAGRALYEANGCGTCHGPEGRGDGPVTKTLHNAPRDLRDGAHFVNGYTVDRIQRTLLTGLVDGISTMPSYAHLSASDRRLLAVFVMSLNTDSKKEQQNASQ
jgi:mono/diheme cytochrome c family protein